MKIYGKFIGKYYFFKGSSQLKIEMKGTLTDISKTVSRKVLCDKACQCSALQGTPWRSYLENLTIDDKFINKWLLLFIHQTCLKRVEKKKNLGRHKKEISLNTFAK